MTHATSLRGDSRARLLRAAVGFALVPRSRRRQNKQYLAAHRRAKAALRRLT